MSEKTIWWDNFENEPTLTRDEAAPPERYTAEPQIRRWKEAQAKEPRHPWAEPAEPAPKPKRAQEADLPGQMSIDDWLEMEGPEDDA